MRVLAYWVDSYMSLPISLYFFVIQQKPFIKYICLLRISVEQLWLQNLHGPSQAGLNVAYQIKQWPAQKTYLSKPVNMTYLGEK